MQPGTRLKDTYEIVRELASGGMGAIYEARHARLGGKRFAVKVIRRDLVGQPEVLERFKREADVMTGLHHPNVVEVVDYDVSHEGEPYLVMELLEGESLDELLERETVLPVDLAVGIVRQALLALGHAHERGVVHRDMKPANLFLVPSGDRIPVVKLLDFGIAKALTASHQLTMTRELLGTPAYMAPEQVMGSGSSTGIGQHTDVYAIGAVLYHLLAGKPPLEANDMAAMVYAVAYREPVPLGQPGSILASAVSRVSIPQPVADVVTRALRKQPAERWATAHDMRVALDDALDRVRNGAFAVAAPSAFNTRTPPAQGTQPSAAIYSSGSGFTPAPSPSGFGPTSIPTPHPAPAAPVVPMTREVSSPSLAMRNRDPDPTPLHGGLNYQTPTPGRPIAATQLSPIHPGAAAGPFLGTSPVPGTIGMAVTPAPGGSYGAPAGFAQYGTPPPGALGPGFTPPPGVGAHSSPQPAEKRSIAGIAAFVVVLLLLGVTMIAAAWYVTDGFHEANNPFASRATQPASVADAGPGVTDLLSADPRVAPDAGAIAWNTPDAGAWATVLDSGMLVAQSLDAGLAVPVEVGGVDAGVPWVVPQPQVPPPVEPAHPPERQEDPVAAARRAGQRAIRARGAGVRACSIAAGFMGRIGGRFRYRADGVLDSVNWHGSYPGSFRNCAAAQLRGIRIRPLPRGLSHLEVDVSWNTASPG